MHTDPDQEDAGDLAAVAAGAGAPVRRQSRRDRPARDTTPKARTLGPDGFQGLPGAQSGEGGHAGNVGFLFGNWGRMPHSMDQRRNVELALKRGPAMIIGLAECQATTEALLNARGEPTPPAVAGVCPPPGLEGRESFEYLTLRGCEEISVLIGLRATMGNQLSLVSWDRRFEGTYKRKTKSLDAYTRVLVARVVLDNPVACIGREHNVMVVHLHHHLANNKWPNKLNAFWPWLAEKLREHDVKVLMGDFNMAFFMVIPELRSRGVVIDLAAWYPWKAREDGEAMSDSCGIFFLNAPGEYRLHRALEDLHDTDARGILSDADVMHTVDYDLIPRKSGPGQPLDLYLPKAADLREKIKPSLTASHQSLATLAEARAAGAARRPNAHTCSHLRVKEKRLDEALWAPGGANVKGSHFPICAFTNNVGRRAPEALARRQQRRPMPRDRQWRQEGHQTQPQRQPERQPHWPRRAGPDAHPLVTPELVNCLQQVLTLARAQS